jgi:hypothetical protein
VPAKSPSDKEADHNVSSRTCQHDGIPDFTRQIHGQWAPRVVADVARALVLAGVMAVPRDCVGRAAPGRVRVLCGR